MKPSGPETLESLARAAAAGDEAAFERLHDRLRAGLERFLLKRTGKRRDLADELAQRAWVEMWRALRERRYDPDRAAFSTFLYAIAYKLWMQHCRANRESTGAATADDPVLEALQHQPNRLDELHLVELLEALRGCREQSDGPGSLTAEERELLNVLAEGASERQAAERLGLAASTVNARKRAAYAKLRACLAAKGFDGGYGIASTDFPARRRTD
ncbi:RNA polymerase sigma factor [Phycisphaerae bacterium RAS1]|nr:RNA polymerase sigma factor [Phycisphaerae bacterium RAS1]